MRRNSRKVMLAIVPMVALFLTGCNEKLPQDSLSPEGKFAKIADHLWDLVFPIAVVVFVLVQVLVLWLVVRYRRKANDGSPEPKQIHGSTKLEIGWTILPAVILAVVGVLSIKTLFQLSDRPAASSNPIHVQVIGHQWWWEFSYPNPEDVSFDEKADSWKSPSCMNIDTNCVRTANELVIPVGRPVDVQIESKDVIHSFWVPKLAGKLDAMSGRKNFLTLQADKAGEYYGQCAEFCGLSHANMRFRVRAVADDEYARWWDGQKMAAAKPTTEAEKLGYELFKTKGCVGCHMVNGESKGNVGPNLTHFATRGRFAGSMFERNDESLRRWLRNAPEEKPGSIMPSGKAMGLTSEEDITNLVAYLNSLK